MTVHADAFPDLVVVKADAASESRPEAGLTRAVMAYNDKLFLAEHKMVKGWAGSLHRHPHDQVVSVVRCHLKNVSSTVREHLSIPAAATASSSAAASNMEPRPWKIPSSLTFSRHAARTTLFDHERCKIPDQLDRRARGLRAAWRRDSLPCTGRARFVPDQSRRSQQGNSGFSCAGG